MSDEDHDDLIKSLQDHVGRVTVRAPPPVAVIRAIRVLEEVRVELKRLTEENARLKKEVTHHTPDSLY